MVWRVNFAHKRLQGRIEQMRKFRRQHEQLRTVIVRVLRPSSNSSQNAAVMTQSTIDLQQEQMEMRPAEIVALEAADSNAIEEVNLAYENVKEVDGLEISKEGSDSWEAAMKRYEDRIDRVETRITSRLRDQLGTAKNANEMFRIFSRFNALFVRPHIRGAIREYQTQLIQRVKDDIEALHTKFKIQYPHSRASRMSTVRDLPPIAGSIIWAKQIDRQLTAYMRRVEDVLGKGWENHVDGQKLKADGDSFRMKLSTQEIFDDWARKVQQRNLGVSGRIFAIDNQRSKTGRGSQLRLKVNFLPEIIQLSKEVRNLKSLGFRVPLAIVNKAHQANQLYPFAISLIESVRTYERSLEKMESRPNVVLLVAGLRREVQNLIAEGIGLVWESYKLDPYVQRLAEIVVLFQEKVDDLLVIEEEIDVDVRSLETCHYSTANFKETLGKIQRAVDDLSLHQYSNLHAWVNKLDEEVERRLAVRLQAGVEAWRQALEGKADGGKSEDDTMDTDSPSQPAHKPGGDPQLRRMMHEIRITNQIMFLYPSLEECRYQMLQQFFSWQAVITSQERIQSSRYQVGLDRPTIQTYRDLLTRLPGGTTILENAYFGVETTVKNVTNYVNEWLRYQALWDLQPDSLVIRFKENISDWMQLLADIKKSRSTFDTSETRREFGPIVIDYGKVQSKVSLKYDSWHKDALSKFGGMLGTEMTTFHGQIAKARVELEQQTIEAASTSEAVNIITDVQNLKRKMKAWEKQVATYKDGQRILERQRFHFPTTWLHVDNVEGEWSAFNEIIRRKNQSIETQVASLQMKIVAEDKQIESRSMDYVNDWERNKPVDGHLRPTEALSKISLFESRYVRLKEERDNVSKAKEALELEEGLQTVGNATSDKLGVGWEELQDLKGVWSELSKIWEHIDEMKDVPWLSVQPRKIRQQIDGLLSQLKDLPARLRQYAGYEYVRRLLQTYSKVNVLVVELKSDALKERHWKTICRDLRVQWVQSDLSLGQVWDVDLLKNETVIRDVLSVAQGEMALEEFLKQVRETWQYYELDLVAYQNKCKLIRGWDDLFNKLKENINQISAMKLSPYFRVFEEEANTWEEKLNRINNLFDVWIDVQRRWVYLEGIFSGNADIANLLPVETSRFNSISAEFLTMMKKVSKSRMVMDVLNIQGIQRSLERLADLLTKVQKALGEYLERERASFPRFYFVGDEDLLEIIGNSKNLPRLQKHFKKMFAGVAALNLSGVDGKLISGMASREGEEVTFDKPVSTLEHPRINEWLEEVENSMRMTLAKFLFNAVSDNKELRSSGSMDEAKFLEWCDKYPAQIVVLAAQVRKKRYQNRSCLKHSLKIHFI
jgi:dynein heavy chain 1